MLQIKSIIADKPGVVIGSASALLGVVFLLHTAILWWPHEPKAQNSINTSAQALEFDIERIVSSNIFTNSRPLETNDKLSTQESIARTNHSEFSLQAIFESSDENRSTVIIAKSGQTPRSYSLGSVLADGISISRIERDRVHLNSHGQSTVLTFKQQPRRPGNTLQRAADNLLEKMSSEGKLGQVKQRLEQLRRQSQEQ